MHGAGNDFIIVQQEDIGIANICSKQIQAWCHRHKGIGADGLLVLHTPENPENHFRMQFFNPDGKEATMCGNGARCIAMFAYEQEIAPSSMQFETQVGTITASVEGENISLDMPVPNDIRLNEELQFQKDNVLPANMIVDFADTGVPHAVIFCPDIQDVDFKAIGPAVRYHEHYAPEGTNVDFVQLVDRQTLRVRTYERGVEGETLACGTGVLACALICIRKELARSPVELITAGGDILKVHADIQRNQIKAVRLTGPAVHVFQGIVTL